MEFPGKFESTNLSRDNLSREVGRSPPDPITSCKSKSQQFEARGSGRGIVAHPDLNEQQLGYR